MKKILLLALLALTACTKEVIVTEIVYQEDTTRILELQAQVSTLTNQLSLSTQNNEDLNDQLDDIQNDLDVLSTQLDDRTIALDDALDQIIELEVMIEEYNIEQERAQEESLLRKSHEQLKTSNVINLRGLTMSKVGDYDIAVNGGDPWWVPVYNIPNGKELSYSIDGTWESYHFRLFYDEAGVLVAAHLVTPNHNGNLFVEAYDYFYQFEDHFYQIIDTL